MPNSLGSMAAKFTARLDEIVERECLTNDLNMNKDLLGELSGVGEVKVPKIVLEGLGDYDRAKGFAPGSATLDWETLRLAHDRGREFEVDRIDDEERAKVLSAKLMGEFVRTQVVPEVDAVRFATLSKAAGTKKDGGLATPEEAFKAVIAMEEVMEDAGCDLSKVVLYMTSAAKGLLRRSQEYRVRADEDPNGRFKLFDDMRLVTVPGKRFVTAVELLKGRDGEEAGGFKKATGGKALNFLAVDPRACAAIAKHETLRYFAPEQNQSKDAHRWQYRLFHDLLTFENKKQLIYASVAAA